jgi:hypothetical protein
MPTPKQIIIVYDDGTTQSYIYDSKVGNITINTAFETREATPDDPEYNRDSKYQRLIQVPYASVEIIASHVLVK